MLKDYVGHLSADILFEVILSKLLPRLILTPSEAGLLHDRMLVGCLEYLARRIILIMGEEEFDGLTLAHQTWIGKSLLQVIFVADRDEVAFFVLVDKLERFWHLLSRIGLLSSVD